MRIGRRIALAAAGAALAFPAIRANAQALRGAALVIGNSRYQWEASLPNVKRDAPDIARRFQALGLKTELVQDAGRDAMRRAIDNLTASARGAEFAAFYFAGHGAAWAKDTYLVPLDADLGSPDSVQNLVPVTSVITALDGAGRRLMVFDNCRNNPADGWRQKEAEQAAFIGDTRSAAPKSADTLVLYSTAPGRVAVDGPAGENSPFAASLLRQLDAPPVDMLTLPERLRRDLLIATAGRQVVFDQSTYQGSFMLNGAAARPTGAVRSGWAADPSKIIELTNTYAFSDQYGLQLPRGLISHRPPAGSVHAQKVGAFKFENATPDGRVPGAIVILSAEEGETAEVVFVTRLGGRGGWRYVRSTMSSDSLTYETRDQGPRFVFKWSDANSGSVTMFPPQRGGGGRSPPVVSSRFTRLDG